MECWITDEQRAESEAAYKELTKILKPNWGGKFLRQYWNSHLEIDDPDVHLALKGVKTRDTPPLSEVWFFYDQYDNNEEYLAVYAFFDETKKTKKGTYRWKLLKNHNKVEYCFLDLWLEKYQGLLSPRRVSENDNIAGTSSNHKMLNSSRHYRSIKKKIFLEPWYGEIRVKPTAYMDRNGRVIEEYLSRLSAESSSKENHLREQHSRRDTSSNAADVSKHIFRKSKRDNVDTVLTARCSNITIGAAYGQQINILI
jgi:hypothetical protein